MSQGVDDQFFVTSGTSGASPGESPYLNRVTWASYKALSRGQLGGLMLGGLLGLGVGLAAAGLGALLIPTTVLASAGLPVGAFAAIVAGGFTAVGAKYYHDVFKQVGAAAGAVSAGEEIREERSQVVNIKLDTMLNVMAREGRITADEIQKIEDDVEAVYAKGHHNFEKKFAPDQTFSWSIGTVGAIAGAAIVAAIGGVGYLAEYIMHGAAPEIGGAMIPLAATALAGGALAGATYGINRNYYRPVLNLANALYEGDPAELEKQRSKQHAVAAGRAGPDFKPIENIDDHAIPVASAAPQTRITLPELDNDRGREMLARRLNSTWQEIQRQRSEEAAHAEQMRLH